MRWLSKVKTPTTLLATTVSGVASRGVGEVECVASLHVGLWTSHTRKCPSVVHRPLDTEIVAGNRDKKPSPLVLRAWVLRVRVR